MAGKQPRVPKGSSSGGQFGKGGAGSDLTPGEVDAVKGYAGTGYASIQKDLRSGKVPEEAHGIDSAIKKSPVDADMTVYRGVSLTRIENGKMTRQSVSEGSILADKGYMSTTTSRATGKRYGDRADLLLTIQLGKGNHALDVKKVTGAGEESEILLPRGTSLRLSNFVAGSGGGPARADATIVSAGALSVDDGEYAKQSRVPKGSSSGGQFGKGGGGLSDAESKEFIDGQYGEWKGGLTPAESSAITFYQSPGYQLMNGKLRGQDVKAPDADMKRAAAATKGLDSAIAKAPPLTRSTTVHRGFSKEQFGSLKKGDTITDRGFVSTSLTRSGAGMFGGEGRGMLATITLPAGTRAGAGSVKEIILPRGSSFRVVSAGKSGVALELVP